MKRRILTGLIALVVSVVAVSAQIDPELLEKAEKGDAGRVISSDVQSMTVVELLMLTLVEVCPRLLGPPNTAHPMPVSTESVNM